MPTSTAGFEMHTFFQGFNFDTLLALISCITGIVALFLSGAAYKKCQVFKNSLNDKATYRDDSQDHSQKAGRDIVNNSCDANALAAISAATFEVSLKKAYEQFEQRTTENLHQIISETDRIIRENHTDLRAYTKIDWINLYFESAKNASDTYMQNVWARVLARELKVPGSFSFKTLDVLKNMSADDFRLFEKLCTIVIDGFILQGEISESRVHWVSQLKLRELGLLNLNSTKRWYTIPAKRKHQFVFGKLTMITVLNNETEKDEKIEFQAYLVTTSALELLAIMNVNYDEEYFFDCAEKLKSCNSRVKVGTYNILSIDSTTITYSTEDLLENRGRTKAS